MTDRKVGSLKQGREVEEETEKDQKRKRVSFVGGSVSSGQEVLMPAAERKESISELIGRAGSAETVVSRVFEAARSHGAQPAPSPPPHSGLRIGETGMILEVRLRLYKNGLTLDDEPLLSYDSAAAKDILESVSRGRAPLVLAKKYPDRQLDLLLENRKDKEYREPQIPFSGPGHMLGFPIPGLTLPPPPSPPAPAPARRAAPDSRSPDRLKGREKAGKCGQVKVRCPDGSLLLIPVEPELTVADLRQVIRRNGPASVSTGPFDLVGAYPCKRIEDEGKTLSELDLINSLLTLKPHNPKTEEGAKNL